MTRPPGFRGYIPSGTPVSFVLTLVICKPFRMTFHTYVFNLSWKFFRAKEVCRYVATGPPRLPFMNWKGMRKN
jgi:hypothetical protein